MLDENLSIVLVSPGWPPANFPNGIVTYVTNLLHGMHEIDEVTAYVFACQQESLASESYVVDLSKIKTDQSLLNRYIDGSIHRVNLELLERFKLSRRCLKLCNQIFYGTKLVEHKPDLIEIEESFGVARHLVTRSDIPVVTRLHGPWFIHGPILNLDFKSDYKPRVESEGAAIRLSHGISAPSLDVLNRVREHYNCFLENAQVIPNPIIPAPENLWWQPDLSKKPFILNVGRFDNHKGGDIAIESFRLIAKHNSEVELWFVGPDNGVILLGKKYTFSDYVKEFIPEASVRNRIKCLGQLDPESIWRLRKQALVTIVVSRYESFSLALLEALSVGSPVVAVGVGGICEIVIDGYNGILAVPNSPESISQCVINLMEDEDKQKMISSNAIKDSIERFSPAVIAKKTLDFYREVLSR